MYIYVYIQGRRDRLRDERGVAEEESIKMVLISILITLLMITIATPGLRNKISA